MAISPFSNRMDWENLLFRFALKISWVQKVCVMLGDMYHEIY